MLGTVATFAGAGCCYSDGTGTNARFYKPYGITIDTNGLLFITELYGHRVRTITLSGCNLFVEEECLYICGMIFYGLCV